MFCLYGKGPVDRNRIIKNRWLPSCPRNFKTESTGIFAINDEIAFGLYRGLAEAGKKIPEDYSIIGYDNVDMCEYVSPPLTTIAQPVFQLGQTTATLLLKESISLQKIGRSKPCLSN